MTIAFLNHRPTRSAGSLGIHVLVTIFITLAANGVVFALGWAGSSPDAARHNWLLPPGWVVGTVWLVLLTLLAVAYWWLASADGSDARRAAPWVIALIAFCLAYPFYTVGFSNIAMELIGNVATIAGAALLARRALRFSLFAASPIALVAVWVSYATFATVAGR